MLTDKKILPFLILPVLNILLTGCALLEEPAKVILDTDSRCENCSMAKRFQNTGPDPQAAIDSAIELTEKNAGLLDENSALKQKAQELAEENQQLKNNIAVLEPQLKQTQKELAQANELLIEMRIELNNWKSSVLGFRNEMRDADKVQLETLRKILEVLGGEFEEAAAQEPGPDAATVSLNDKMNNEKNNLGQTE